MNVWFGSDWGAPICQSHPHVAVPRGEACRWCDEPIAPDDSGVGMLFMESEGNALVPTLAYTHVECFLRQVLGSVGHQLRLCPCFGGDYEGEPDGMSTRDAARAAYELAMQRVKETADGQA